VVFLGNLKSMLPRNFLPIAPDHANAVQPRDLLFGQISLDLTLAHTALCDQPHAKAQTSGRGIQFRNVQVSMLRVVDACLREIVLPAGRKAGLQLLKQHPAVMHLLDDLEPLGHDLIALTIGIEPVNSLLHLTLQAGNTGQPLKIVDHIQNQRGCGIPCGQSPADLLLVDDGRNRRSEQNDTRNPLHMNALVKHIDAEQQLQPVADVRFEVRKGLIGIWIIRIGLIHCHMWVDPCKPLWHMGHHLVHMLLVGAEHDVLARFVCDMMGKDLVQTVSLFQCPAQCVQIFLIHVLNARCSQVIHPRLILCKCFLVLIHGGHILRGRQNSPDDCFAKGHVARNTAVEKLFGHVAVIVQISDICCRQPKQFCIRA